MKTFFSGIAFLVLAVIALVTPIFVAMIGLGIVHDIHPAVPALGFVTVLWGLVITGIVGTFFHGNSLYKGSQ